LDIGEFQQLAEGSVAKLLHFRHHDHPHRDPEGEAFEQPVVIFTLDGTWRYRSLCEDVSVDPALVVLGHAGQAYRCRHDEEIPRDRHLVIVLNEPVLEELVSRYPSPTPFPSTDRLFPRTVIRKTPSIASLQHAIMSEAAQKRTGHLFRIDLVAMELLVEIARLSEPQRDPPLPRGPRHRDRIEAAAAHLAAHLADEPDLAALARTAGLSPFHFSRVFKAHTGVPPHRYLTGLRLEEAKRLLRDSALSVTDICYEVGFRNLSHFIAAFRAHAGVTPSRYRRH
jgi:AraC-like DNA-binding protein